MWHRGISVLLTIPLSSCLHVLPYIYSPAPLPSLILSHLPLSSPLIPVLLWRTQRLSCPFAFRNMTPGNPQTGSAGS